MKTTLLYSTRGLVISSALTIWFALVSLSVVWGQACPSGCCCGGCNTCDFVGSDQVIYQNNCGPYTFNINCNGYGLSGVEWSIQETAYATIDVKDNNHITFRPTNAGYGKDIHVCARPANAPNAIPCCKVIRFCPSLEVSPDYYAKLETSSGQVAALFGSTCAPGGWQSLTFSRYDAGGYLIENVAVSNTTGRYKFYFNSTGQNSQYYNLKVSGVGVPGCPNATSSCIKVHYVPYNNSGATYYVVIDGAGNCGDGGGGGPARMGSGGEAVELLTVYPNPVNEGTVTFKTAKVMTTLSIVDLLGRTQYVSHPNAVQAEVNCTRLTVGTYLANIVTEDGQFTKKFVIQQ